MKTISYKGFEIKLTGNPEFKYKIIGAAVYEPNNTKYCFAKNLEECKEYINLWLKQNHLLQWCTIHNNVRDAYNSVIHL